MYTSRTHQCFLIALEGADRLGKTTQAKRLEPALEQVGIKGVVEKMPYQDGVTYDRIYEMLHTGEALQEPVAFQTFMGVNRLGFQSNYLPTLAEHFEVVILDRWNLSTLVYGAQSGVSEETTKVILKGVSEPDLVLIFDGEPFSSTETDDSYEANLEFQDRVQRAYRDWGNAHPEKTVFIRANQAPDLVTKDILAAIRACLGR